MKDQVSTETFYMIITNILLSITSRSQITHTKINDCQYQVDRLHQIWFEICVSRFHEWTRRGILDKILFELKAQNKINKIGIIK